MTEPPAPASAGTTDPAPVAVAPAPPAASASGPTRASSRLLTVIAVVALAAAAYAIYRLDNVRREAARQIADLDQTTTRATGIAQRAESEARAARERLSVLEARLVEEQGQREALEQLYADLSRGRDEAVLVEVERLIVLAAQELAISGNVNTALAALQTADARLGRSDTPRFLPLRRVLARDIERLKSAPAIDVTGMALRLDQLAAGVDQWQLVSDAKAVTSTASPLATTGAASPPATSGWERWIERVRRELGEYRDLIQIRRVDAPDALWLNSAQQQLVRQQLRLRLLTARQALLARNDRLFRSDLTEALGLLTRNFDTRQAAVSAAATQMKQLAAMPLSVEAPQINDSVAAARAARTAPGAR